MVCLIVEYNPRKLKRRREDATLPFLQLTLVSVNMYLRFLKLQLLNCMPFALYSLHFASIFPGTITCFKLLQTLFDKGNSKCVETLLDILFMKLLTVSVLEQRLPCSLFHSF